MFAPLALTPLSVDNFIRDRATTDLVSNCGAVAAFRMLLRGKVLPGFRIPGFPKRWYAHLQVATAQRFFTTGTAELPARALQHLSIQVSEWLQVEGADQHIVARISCFSILSG